MRVAQRRTVEGIEGEITSRIDLSIRHSCPQQYGHMLSRDSTCPFACSELVK